MSMESSDFGARDYSDGMTKQSFRDSCDINKIIKKAQVAGSLSHLLKYDKAVYGEFTGVDLLTAYQQVERAQEIFNDLPSEVRAEFDQDAFKFAAFASDPRNIDRLDELLPAIAQPGDYRFPKPGDPPPVAPEKPSATSSAAEQPAVAGGPTSSAGEEPAPSDGASASSST